MFVTNWISTTKIQKISEITNFFRHYFLSRTEVYIIFITKGGLNNSSIFVLPTILHQVTESCALVARKHNVNKTNS